ncbi:MAG: phospholipase D-like domain-containing protein [Actinomycetota bacterium]|nr:phospholipase D-like domain-containing protein [Actinomycetota bacterium]
MDRSEEIRRYRRALEGLIGVPATEGNHIEILRNGDRIFEAMFDAVRSAESTIDFLTFVYWEGAIGEDLAKALCQRARAGVRVRVLLDALGASTMDKELLVRMDESGIAVERFRMVDKLHFWQTNNRTHRKVLICDEKVGFTGGVGIADEWRGDARNPDEWRDTHFQLRGPVVDGLRAAFLQNWAETGRPLFDEEVDRFPCQPDDGSAAIQVVRGQAQAGWTDVTTLFRALLLLARRRVRITTAYFVPDDETSQLLCQTARRGVEVEVLVPGPHIDKRFVQLASEAQFEPLLEAGVKLHAYQPTMLHAKIMTVDGLIANVGSANFDARSLTLDDEVNLVVFNAETAAALDADFEADRERSEAIALESWDDRSLLQKAKEAATNIYDRHV